MSVRGIGWLLCLLCVGCVDVPEVSNPPAPGSDGGAAADAGPFVFDAGPPPTDSAPPTIRITSPSDAAQLASAVTSFTVEGTASDDVGVAAVRVAIGPNEPVLASTADFWRTWRVTLPMPAGSQRIRAIATDDAGHVTEASVTVTRAPAAADAAPPVVVITSPADGTRTARGQILVTGTASDDSGLALVEAKVDGLADFAPVTTSDTFANWRATLTLAPGVTNRIVARATDLAGNRTQQSIQVTVTTAADREAPTLVVTSPAPGATLSAATVDVVGTATDNVAVAKVEVAVGDGAYALAQTSNGFAAWRATVALRSGANHLRVRATDTSDIETVVGLDVTASFTPAYSDPLSYELRLAAPRDRSVRLVLDKAGMGEVIPQSVRQTITILNLDPTALMTATMESIKNRCGLDWRNAGAPICSPSDWGQPEKNLWTLLTMTPANVNVAGTSVAGVKDIADTLSGLGLIDDFSTILWETLGLPAKTSEIVDTATAVSALKDDLIKTHPKANADGTLPVTIEDGYTDMRSLSTKFGPQGAHPGFLDPSAPTYSKVLLDTFQMSVTGTSNLTWYDGLDLSKGKDYIAILPTPTSDVITFDFAHTLAVSGLAASPTVDLTFTMSEHPAFLSAATLANDQQPPAPPGNGQAWTASKWLIEYVLVDASYRKYRTRPAYEHLYEVPVLGTDESEIVVGRNGSATTIFGDLRIPAIANPYLGWARFWTLFGLGNPPQAQYLWDMIAEISQIRLRDGGVAEGQGNTRFKLTGLPVGITGPQIVAQMRPALEAQKSLLAQRLLGDYRTNNGAVDFYLRGVAGDLYLFFANAVDPLPRAVTYSTPGFFSDAALTQKVSTTAALTSGDAIHEKVKLDGNPRTLYVQGKDGAVYKLSLDGAQSDRVTLTVSRKL